MANVEFEVSAKTIPHTLAPSQILLVSDHPLCDNDLASQAQSELSWPFSSFPSKRDRSPQSLPPASTFAIPASLQFSLYPEGSKGSGKAVTGAVKPRREISLINPGWVGAKDGADWRKEFEAETERLREKKRAAIRSEDDGELEEGEMRLKVKEEHVPVMARSPSCGRRSPANPPPLRVSRLPPLAVKVTSRLHQPQRPSLLSPTTGPVLSTPLPSPRLPSTPPSSPPLLPRSARAEPNLGPMSRYLVAKPPPAPFSHAHQASILAFLKFCAPIANWSTLSRERQPELDPSKHGREVAQVLRCSVDGLKTGRIQVDRSSTEPEKSEIAAWRALAVVLEWIWGGTHTRRWDEVRFIQQDSSPPLHRILRIYADEYRYRRRILMAWSDLHFYLVSRQPRELTPHLRRAKLLVRRLDGSTCLNGKESTRDWFFSDEFDTPRDRPWLGWFKSLGETDEVINRRLDDWERKAKRLREMKPRRNES